MALPLSAQCSVVQARSTCPLLTLTRPLSRLPGGYDGSDVEFSWLRGNDSVRGLENLRLAQYTIQRYFTLVTRTQQETGTWWGRPYKRKTAGSEISFRLHLHLPWAPLRRGGVAGFGIGTFTCSTPSTHAAPRASASGEGEDKDTSSHDATGII